MVIAITPECRSASSRNRDRLRRNTQALRWAAFTTMFPDGRWKAGRKASAMRTFGFGFTERHPPGAREEEKGLLTLPLRTLALVTHRPESVRSLSIIRRPERRIVGLVRQRCQGRPVQLLEQAPARAFSFVECPSRSATINSHAGGPAGRDRPWPSPCDGRFGGGLRRPRNFPTGGRRWSRSGIAVPRR